MPEAPREAPRHISDARGPPVSAPAARLFASFDAPDSELLALVAMVGEAQRLERQSQYAAARELYELALRHHALASAHAKNDSPARHGMAWGARSAAADPRAKAASRSGNAR